MGGGKSVAICAVSLRYPSPNPAYITDSFLANAPGIRIIPSRSAVLLGTYLWARLYHSHSLL